MCGCWHESVEDVSSSKLIGYSGDSLVVYIEEKKEETCLSKPLGDDCFTREKGTRIVVDNFYTQKNVWKSGKIKDQYITDVYDLVDDSTIVEYNKSEASFYKWILGDGYERLGAFAWSGCDMGKDVKEIRPWGKGKWRLMGGNSNCAYAIVEIENKKVMAYEKLDDFAEGCSDLWVHDGIEYCVGAVKKDTVMSYYERFLAGAIVKNSKGVSDTLWNNQIEGAGLSSYHAVLYKNSFICYLSHYYKVDYKSVKMVFDH